MPERQLDIHLRSGPGKPNGPPVFLVGLMKCAVTFVCLGPWISTGALPHSTYAGTDSQGQSQSMRLRETWVVMECRVSSATLCVSFRRSLSQDRVSQWAESSFEKVSANGIRRSQGDADLSAQQTWSTPLCTRGVRLMHAAQSNGRRLSA